MPVRFSASGSCTVNDVTVHLTGAGSCTITASGDGNVDYDPPPDVSRTFTIAKAQQGIAFGLLVDRPYGAPDFTVSATASSGLAVSFVASGSCTVNGATVHLTGAGSCTITASGDGNGDYDRPPDVSRSFTIAKVQQFTIRASPDTQRGRCGRSVRAIAFAFGARTGVLRISMPSLANTASRRSPAP